MNRRGFLTGLGAAAAGLIAMPAPTKMWFVGAHMATPGYTMQGGLFIPASDVRAVDRDILRDEHILVTHDNRAGHIVSTTNPEQLREDWADRRLREYETRMHDLGTALRATGDWVT